MLDILFAFGLGFSVMAMGCFAVANQDDGIQSAGITAIAALVLFGIVLTFKDSGLVNPRGMIKYLTEQAVTTHLTKTIIGASLGLIFVLYLEGTFVWIWRRVHPASAPTDMIGAGQRGHIAKAPRSGCKDNGAD